jgi:hypothetical protein
VPDEARGYLPGWIVNETLEGQDAESTTLAALKAKVLGHHPEGDYTAEDNQSGTSGTKSNRTLEDAALARETFAEVVLADGGEVSQFATTSIPFINSDWAPKTGQDLAVIYSIEDESSQI